MEVLAKTAAASSGHMVTEKNNPRIEPNFSG
jgi:hypothetical protein